MKIEIIDRKDDPIYHQERFHIMVNDECVASTNNYEIVQIIIEGIKKLFKIKGKRK